MKNALLLQELQDYNNESKFQKAGADYIISPTKIAANKISSLATRKNISEYINLLNESHVEGFSLEFVEILPHSSLTGKELKDAKIPQMTGLIVMGIETDGKMQMNPTSSTIIQKDSKLLVFGTEEQLERLKAIAETANVL